MGSIKRTASYKDLKNIETICPFTDEQVRQMNKEYLQLSPIDFAKKYREVLFTPSGIKEINLFIPELASFKQ